jgi:hypothetical protein
MFRSNVACVFPGLQCLLPVNRVNGTNIHNGYKYVNNLVQIVIVENAIATVTAILFSFFPIGNQEKYPLQRLICVC